MVGGPFLGEIGQYGLPPACGMVKARDEPGALRPIGVSSSLFPDVFPGTAPSRRRAWSARVYARLLRTGIEHQL